MEVIKEVRVEVPIEARQEVQVEETAAAVAAAVAAERARLEEEKAAAIAAAVAAERAKAPVASCPPPADEAVKPVDRDPSAAASTSELAQPPPAVVAATVEAEQRAEEAEQQVADAEEIIARLEEELATVRAAEPESVDSVRSVFTKDAGWVEVSVSSEAEIRARAAVKMQASFRAKKARKEVEAMKEEKRPGKKPMPNLNQKPRYLQSSGPPPNRERRGSTKEAPNLDQLPRYLQPKEGGGPSKSEEARARRASIAERRKSVAPGPASQAAAKLPKRRASIAPAPPAAAAKHQPALPPTIEEPPAAAAAAPPPPPPARPPPEPPALPPRPKTSDAQPPRSRAPRLPAHLEKYSVARAAPARPQTARADEREQQDTEPPEIPRKAEPLRRPAPPTEFLHTPRAASDETPEIVHVEPEEEVEEPEPEPEKPPLVVAVSTSMDNTAPVANQEHVQQTMISLSVPKVRSSERAPISVVAVVDNSGSMDVNLRSLKTSLAFLVRHGLDERDKLGLVIFGNEATVEMPLTVLDDAGKQLAIASIEGMVAEGKTNLSGAVLAGLDLLGGEAGDEATKALMVFTDSKTNRGTKAAASLVAECREQVEDAGMAGDVMINTMGYGYDHNERQLRELADAFGGKYYFIEDPRLIPDAINDCMGGLVNVAGQQAELIVEADPSEATLGQPVTHHPWTMDDDRLRMKIALGTLYGDQEKDILLSLHLPRKDTARESEKPAFTAYLRYKNAETSEPEERIFSQTISRPAQPPRRGGWLGGGGGMAGPAGPQAPPNAKLDAARLRMGATQAMSEATRLADGGRLDLARQALREAATLSRQAATSDNPVASQLVSDLERLEGGFADEAAYDQFGRKRTEMTRMAQLQQRRGPSPPPQEEQGGYVEGYLSARRVHDEPARSGSGAFLPSLPRNRQVAGAYGTLDGGGGGSRPPSGRDGGGGGGIGRNPFRSRAPRVLPPAPRQGAFLDE